MNGRPEGWDPRVSMKFLKPGELARFAYETDYWDNPKRWRVFIDDPRNPELNRYPVEFANVYHDEIFMVLDSFHFRNNTFWLEVLHPNLGRVFIRGHYEVGDVDPSRRMFVQV